MDDLVKKKWIAIIPARGGSKRIPKKNIIEIMGLPMIVHTIKAALNSNLFSEVIVSTDCDEIAKVSIEAGARVPFLREEYSDDYSTVSEATIYTLSRLITDFGEKYDNVVQLMPNCPLRNQSDILKASIFFESNDNNFQISCFKYGWMNPWWAHTINDNNVAKPIFSDDLRVKRSQDLQELYCPTGAIWIAKVEKLFEARTFYGQNYVFCPMSWQNSIDIDDYEDLKMVNCLINNE